MCLFPIPPARSDPPLLHLHTHIGVPFPRPPYPPFPRCSLPLPCLCSYLPPLPPLPTPAPPLCTLAAEAPPGSDHRDHSALLLPPPDRGKMCLSANVEATRGEGGSSSSGLGSRHPWLLPVCERRCHVSAGLIGDSPPALCSPFSALLSPPLGSRLLRSPPPFETPFLGFEQFELFES